MDLLNKSKEYEEGFKACINGQSTISNPYQWRPHSNFNNIAYLNWYKGWNDCFYGKNIYKGDIDP